MFPRGLTRKDQVRMVAPQYHREDQEQKEDHHEAHEHSMDMIPLFPLGQVLFRVWEVRVSISVATSCNFERHDLLPCLEEQEEPELSMVKLTHAATNPEAMVVKLPHTSVAVPAVAAPIGLHHLTYLTEPFLGEVSALLPWLVLDCRDFIAVHDLCLLLTICLIEL